ncbi:ATP-binding protein [Nocardioides sp. YIM 152315]|uniref:ATP-binding protein n=1 Tax=Nocardioides sp. YIM 152315 TaxID=3031760 RepID=UPI0023DCE611|nr:ATP-binding protein [Nocardioides sp. YIM 152315]MDF1606117.1 ATP-binding protein [Nocardioides sp. YIM 152315]
MGALEAAREAAASAVARRAELGWPQQEQAEQALEAAFAGLLHDATGAALDDSLAEVEFRFRLTPIDLGLLTVATVAELDPAAHLLLGLLSGDPGPARPSVALALELAGAPVSSPGARARLAEHAPLVRDGLLRVVGTDVLLTRRLVVPDRVAAHLTSPDGPPAAVLVPHLVDTVPLDVDGAETVADGLRRGERLVWVHAGAGAAGVALAAGACGRLDVDHLCVDLAGVPEAQSAEDLLRAAVLEAGLRGAVLVLGGADRASASVQLLLDAAVPVVAVSQQPWDPRWAHELPLSVTAPRLTLADREQLWAPLLAPDPVPREITALRMTPEDIARVGRHAVRQAALSGEPVTPAVVRRSARRLSQRHHPDGAGAGTLGLDDLILPEHAASEVRRMLDWARYRDELLAQAPLQGKGGKGTGICTLFAGGPGTGKTLAAHVVADELGIELMQVDLPSVVSKYIGETEKNLERVFSEAESLNALLFFDEADSLFGSRSEVRDARDRYANQEVSYLLQRMEHFDGITVLATNLRGNVDPAFARRLHFIVTFPDPDEATRKELWAHHLGQLPSTDPDDPLDPGALAGLDLAGGGIRNVVLSAAYAAIADGAPVGMRHLASAAVREYTKLGRRVPSVDFLADAERR